MVVSNGFVSKGLVLKFIIASSSVLLLPDFIGTGCGEGCPEPMACFNLNQSFLIIAIFIFSKTFFQLYLIRSTLIYISIFAAFHLSIEN
jgi:hypothetical protein